MKTKRIAFTVLFAVLFTVIANSVYLHFSIKNICNRTEAAQVYSQGAFDEYNEIYAFYKKHEHLISLTVNHDDLANIDDLYCEIIGEIGICDNEAASVTKSRLIGALRHLRRLSGINIDSII